MNCGCLKFIHQLAEDWKRDYEWKIMGMSNIDHFIKRRVKNETISWVADQLAAVQLEAVQSNIITKEQISYEI